MKTVSVFTDGSCMKKKTGTVCGYGIHFPNGEIQDISRKFTHKPLTNQRAELFAIYVSLIIIKKLLNLNIKEDKIVVHTDSDYSIKCYTTWARSWEKNDWKTSNNSPVKNQDIIKPTYDIIKKLHNCVTFIHVPSHTNKTDALSMGNAKADKLATNGALSSAISHQKSERNNN